MSKKGRTAITPTRAEDYPEWYQQVVKASDLAENSPVRGCMVIKPWGYALWENMQKILDRRFKETGHQNAYFPLFIPLSYLEREAEHVEGFAKECAVVTHHRLEKNKEGKLVPAGPLEEPLVVRPTSEMMIGEMFSKWIESYRDLPLLINQWANVVRWEMRTRLFLRTTEFLWQEGHTAHSTKEEAFKHALIMLEIYRDFLENTLAIPVICGEKTESERFPGAIHTYTLEAMMQDGKALQAGTSHFLGQNFSKAANITFRDNLEKEQFVWTTSWGMTTRLIGAMVMVHSDDDGLIMPPKVATRHISILPLEHKGGEIDAVKKYSRELKRKLEKIHYCGEPLKVEIDNRDVRSGDKVWSSIKKGVPIRIEIGPREIDQRILTLFKRNKGHKELFKQTEKDLLSTVTQQLDEIQKDLFNRAKTFQEENLVSLNSKGEIYAFFKEKKGFVSAHWSGEAQVEEMLQNDLSVTIRCIPTGGSQEPGNCPFTGKPSAQRIILAKAY